MAAQTFDADRFQPRRISLVLAALAALVAMVSLTGWLGGNPDFASYGEQFVPMPPGTAIGLILLSGALLFAFRPASAVLTQRAAVLVGGLVGAYGLLVFIEWLTGWQTSPDKALFPEMGKLGAHPLGRMSPATGALFLLAGISLIALVRGRSRSGNHADFSLSLAGILGLVVAIFGLVFVLGYACGEPFFYEGAAIPVALPGAIALLFLGAALATAAALHRFVSGCWFQPLNDISIGAQLKFGLVLILGLVLLLGALDWVQTNKLWQQTETLYEHPLQVRIAAGKITADVDMISHRFIDLFQPESGREFTDTLQTIELRKLDMERQLAILDERYLGPRDDVRALREEFVKWNTVISDTIFQLRAGKTPAVQSGVSGSGDEAVKSCLSKINDFAMNKSVELFHMATKQKDGITHQLGAIVAIILLLTLAIIWILLNGIKVPLADLTSVTDQFRQGNLDIRCRYDSANEFGVLSVAFNSMAETLQAKMRISQAAAEIAVILLREDEPHAFCHEMLKTLLLHTGSQMGAVYFLNEAGTVFEHFESIGMGGGARPSFSATGFEGELGAALATHKIQHITDISAETCFAFSAASGHFHPREILTIPVPSDHTISAVISLASLHAYDAFSLRLVDVIWSVLTARVNGILAFRKIRNLAGQLECQNSELDAKNHELDAQNHELDMQKRELDEANRLKSTFLANMSHELRTPLNSVIALSGVLSRRLAKSIPSEDCSYLEIIERNGKSLLLLINDILDLSRVEAGREDISVTRFSLRELADEIVAMIEPQIKEKKIELLNQVPADLPILSSDPDKLRHILQNLVGNAAKFTEHGRISIEAGAWRSTPGDPRSAIQISVTDTGIGIPADKLIHIFDEFRQVDESTSRKYGGSGLGLAIAKKYAELLDGTITVESALGKGSTFTVRLPMAPPELPVPASAANANRPAPAPAARLSPDPSGKNILLVEDNEAAIIQLTDILQARGYRIRVAHDGKEALAQIDRTLPDAMILDLMMPDVDGFQVLKAIRSEQRTSSVPVLILTAKHVTKDELSFLKGNHIHQLIQKGDINKEGLLAAVARMVAPPPASRSRPHKPVVLVVDDDADCRFTTSALLRDGWHIIEAADGLAGIEQARTHRPDIVLMDIGMPVMDGVQALKEIREDESLRHLPVVALTASAMKGDEEMILSYGFDAYLSKPVDAELLVKSLNEVLD